VVDRHVGDHRAGRRGIAPQGESETAARVGASSVDMAAGRMIDARRELWIDGACGLFGASVHAGVAALGGLGMAPRLWLIGAAVSVGYAAVAWVSAWRSARAGLARMIWMNRAWVVACVVGAIAVATGFARAMVGGEAVVVGALSLWEARVLARDRGAAR
jgi:hypothetical protein